MVVDVYESIRSLYPQTHRGDRTGSAVTLWARSLWSINVNVWSPGQGQGKRWYEEVPYYICGSNIRPATRISTHFNLIIVALFKFKLYRLLTKNKNFHFTDQERSHIDTLNSIGHLLNQSKFFIADSSDHYWYNMDLSGWRHAMHSSWKDWWQASI